MLLRRRRVGQRQPGQPAEPLPHRLQVGEHLARWNSSDNALITGTRLTPAISSMRS